MRNVIGEAIYGIHDVGDKSKRRVRRIKSRIDSCGIGTERAVEMFVSGVESHAAWDRT